MLQNDPYWDERPEEKPPADPVQPPVWVYPDPGNIYIPIIPGISWGGTGGSGSGGGGSGGSGGGSGSGGGGSGGSGDIWYDLIDSSWGMTTPLLLIDGSGLLLTEGNGVLLKGVDGCLTIDIDCQIQGDNGQHVRCIILRSILDKQESKEDTGANFLLQNLIGRGKITLAACWQKGHWNYAAIHTVRFRIRDGKEQEVITPWLRLAMNPAKTNFAEMSLDENGLNIQSIRS